MKVFVINLAKNPERMAYVGGQLDELGVAYERFEAVYGKELTSEEREEKISRFRSWCAMGHIIDDGEAGCALSHCGIYQKMIEENIPYACVLEDDVKISSEFTDVLKRIDEWIKPQEPQVVMLSAHMASHIGARGIFSLKNASCTDGYVITYPSAQAILNANYPVVTVADKWGRWVKRDLIKMWRVYPTTIEQDKQVCAVSNIAVGLHMSIRLMPFWKRFLYYLRRIVGLSIDKVYWLVWKK